jgi:hypothetical protein
MTMKARIRKASSIAVLLLASLATLSCGGSMMLPTQRLSDVPSDKAVVTFIRATAFGGAIDFGIWDGERVVGVLDPRAYIQYTCDPGEHVFLGRAENWSAVKATLEAGRKYYILANVSMGVWKARIVFEPITKTSTDRTDDDIAMWLNDLMSRPRDHSRLRCGSSQIS